MTTLETLKRHPRVEHVSVEDGGDLLFVYLKAPWSRYRTGRADGASKGFDVSNVAVGEEDLTHAQNAARALHWVRHEVFNTGSSGQ